MRTHIIRFLRVGLQTAHPCQILFILLGLFFSGLASAVTPMVATGSLHTVALKSDGTVVAWGRNHDCILGDGTCTDRLSPVAVPGLTGVVAVAVGFAHTVALKSDGTVVAWGLNIQGELGDGTTAFHLSPVAVPGLTGVVAVAAGSLHTVALKSDGTLVAWGSNWCNQLGDGTTTDRHSPVAVPGLTGVVAVAAGGCFTVALKSDGTAVAWGNGQSPVIVPGLTGVVAVSASGAHAVALKSDGTVVAWGGNNYGQLGDGTKTDRLSPVAVSSLTGVMAVSAGGVFSFTVALKSDGTMVAWGDNYYGQLGDGTTTVRLSPVAVSGLTGVVAISAGASHTVAIKSDGTVAVWGWNIYGKLGDGTWTDRHSPVAVPGLNLATISDARVFAFAEANYPTLFAGTPVEGQYLQYHYRYYPGSGNYLAVDTNGEIVILGPVSGNVITSVGMVSAYASYITAWEATQAH